MAGPPDNKVARPEASTREQFDDKTRVGDLGSGQAELFTSSACLPASIDVGPFGIAEWWLASVLNLTVDQLHVWHDGQLGAPRDYAYRSTGYFYTAGGIRRILELRGQAGKVDVIEHKVPPPAKPKVCLDRRPGFVHRSAAAIEAQEIR